MQFRQWPLSKQIEAPKRQWQKTTKPQARPLLFPANVPCGIPILAPTLRRDRWQLVRAHRCQIVKLEVDMALQKRLMFSLLIAGLSFPVIKFALGQSGDQTPDLSSLSDADLKTLTIQLERTACYGTCPAYSVTIHGDGRVEYNGKSHVKETGSREGRIETDKIKSLASGFGKTKFWGIAEDYSEAKCKGRVCTDMPTTITELSIRGATHRVNHYYGCGSAPKTLFELESLIDKSANSEQWTGDAKGGPFGTTCWDKN
jgi:hypothetical protein